VKGNGIGCRGEGGWHAQELRVLNFVEEREKNNWLWVHFADGTSHKQDGRPDAEQPPLVGIKKRGKKKKKKKKKK